MFEPLLPTFVLRVGSTIARNQGDNSRCSARMTGKTNIEITQTRLNTVKCKEHMRTAFLSNLIIKRTSILRPHSFDGVEVASFDNSSAGVYQRRRTWK